MTIGDIIRCARKSKNMTQKQLGEASGIAEPTIRKYESGRLNPKPSTLQKIATAIDLPLSFFLATPPFEDIGFLNDFKEVILSALAEKGLMDLGTKDVDEIGDYDFWKAIANHIASIVRVDVNLLSMQYARPQGVAGEIIEFSPDLLGSDHSYLRHFEYGEEKQLPDLSGKTVAFYSSLVFPNEIQAFCHFIDLLGYRVTSEDDRFYLQSKETKIEVPVAELSRLVRTSETTVGALVQELMTRYSSNPNLQETEKPPQD